MTQLALRCPDRLFFVTNFGNGTGPGTGTVGEYTTSGATVNAALISGLGSPIGIVIGADVAAVPEPTTLAFFCLGLAGMVVFTRRKKA